MATTPHPASTAAHPGHHPTHGGHAAHAGHATHAGGEHVPGTMDIAAHERTFEGFVKIAAWSAIASLLVLVFLALTNA